MKTDRLLTLATLVVICVVCSRLFSNSMMSGSYENRPDARSTGFTTNYASAYLGATLTDFSYACKGASSVLNEDVEKYMICFCEAERKMFTVQLLREIEVRIITVTNLEHFSSGVRNFTLLGSKKYPTNAWRVLGSFEAGPWRGTQHFDVATQEPVRFMRFMWATSHGDDSWCTMTTFKVFGVDVLETLTEDYRVDVDEHQQSAELLDLVLAELPPSSSDNDTHRMGTVDAGAQLPFEGEPKISEDDTLFDLIDEEELAPGFGGGVGKEGDDNSNNNNNNNSSSSSNNNNSSDNEKEKETMVKVGSVPSGCCSRCGISDNCFVKWFQYDSDAHAPCPMCMCLAPTEFLHRATLPFKPFQGGAALQILMLMSRQLKTLQQGLEGSLAHKRVMQMKFEQMEKKLRFIGMSLHDAFLSNGDYRDKMLEMKKEIDVMKSRLSLQLDQRGYEENISMLKVWVVCSNLLALIAMITTCLTVHSNISGGGHRFSLRKSFSPLQKPQ